MSMETEVLRTNDRSKWIELVESTSFADIHSHPDYLMLFERYLGSEGRLLHIHDEDGSILFPYFLREIDNGTYDATSPWYYGGPLVHGVWKDSKMDEALGSMKDHFIEVGAASVFSRFNPYLDNHRFLDGRLHVRQIANVVPVLLDRSMDEIFHGSFSQTCRRMIRKGQRSGLEVTVHDSSDLLPTFHEMYIRSMEEKEADEFYHFDLDTLKDLFELFPEGAMLLTAHRGDQLVGASINLHMYGRMYYFLGARDMDGPDLNPSNLMFLESIRFGLEKGLEVFDLGGGPEGSGLLRFKMGFSKVTRPLYGLNMIVDREKYSNLCVERGMETGSVMFEEAGFFPEYRANGGNG